MLLPSFSTGVVFFHKCLIQKGLDRLERNEVLLFSWQHLLQAWRANDSQSSPLSAALASSLHNKAKHLSLFLFSFMIQRNLHKV